MSNEIINILKKVNFKKEEVISKKIKEDIEKWADSFEFEEFKSFMTKIEIITSEQYDVFELGCDFLIEDRNIKSSTINYTANLANQINFSQTSNPWEAELPKWSNFSNVKNEYPLSETVKVFPCPSCNGTKQVICHFCQGTGAIPCKECGGRTRVKCPNCLGHASLDNKICSYCSGKGEVPCLHCGTMFGGARNHKVGVGREVCTNCNGSGQISCKGCQGYGHKVSFSYIEDSFNVKNLLRIENELSEEDQWIFESEIYKNNFSDYLTYSFQSDNELKTILADNTLSNNYKQLYDDLSISTDLSSNKVVAHRITLRTNLIHKITYLYKEENFTCFVLGDSVIARVSPMSKKQDVVKKEQQIRSLHFQEICWKVTLSLFMTTIFTFYILTLFGVKTPWAESWSDAFSLIYDFFMDTGSWTFALIIIPAGLIGIGITSALSLNSFESGCLSWIIITAIFTVLSNSIISFLGANFIMGTQSIVWIIGHFIFILALWILFPMRISKEIESLKGQHPTSSELEE